jgi:hypothetical protein
VRGIYELGGVGGDVPTDMPRALRVGQSVVARHPATRMAADGIVLTIKPSKYRVQFNRCVGVSCVCRSCMHAHSRPHVHACSHGECKLATNWNALGKFASVHACMLCMLRERNRMRKRKKRLPLL